MKLNYKRTLLVGFAFFLISAFWQAYDAIIPLMLTNKFGMSQTVSGFIMSLDNILALFMLPLFGALSDKKDTRFGKRTPFIVIGAIAAIVCFVGLTFADNAQLKQFDGMTRENYWELNYEVENREYNPITNNYKEIAETYTVRDYAAKIFYNKAYADLTPAEQQALKSWYINEGEDEKGLNFDTCYVYDVKKDDAGKFVSEEYKLCYVTKVDGKDTKTYYATDQAIEKGTLTTNAYSSVVSEAVSKYAAEVTKANWWILAIFIVVLLMTLISMATFRSPAVALMPDVTVKPLRSKGNAIINLMGTAGGILVLLLGMIIGTGQVKNQMMSYTGFVCAVCGIMLAALIVFMLTVKEKRWNAEMLDAQAKLDEEEAKEKAEAAAKESAADTTPTADTAKLDTETTATEEVGAEPKREKLPKDKLVSLILILASVALWFTGYNAITSKYSVYATNVLNKDYNTTLLVAQAAAVIAYIPVGILASKIGRKKSILIGVGLLAVAFGGAIFIDASTPGWVMYILFALAGIAWATINVNSFPMVVELAKGPNVGQYTGYYYTASMAAQVITPILSGAFMDVFGSMTVLFPYATIFVALSFVTMVFVKHGDSRPETPKDKMEMLAGADD